MILIRGGGYKLMAYIRKTSVLYGILLFLVIKAIELVTSPFVPHNKRETAILYIYIHIYGGFLFVSHHGFNKRGEVTS